MAPFLHPFVLGGSIWSIWRSWTHLEADAIEGYTASSKLNWVLSISEVLEVGDIGMFKDEISEDLYTTCDTDPVVVKISLVYIQISFAFAMPLPSS